MQQIASRENPKLIHMAKLMQSKSLRRQERLFVAEGLRLCQEVLQAGLAVRLALFTPEFLARQPHFAAQLQQAAAESCEISERLAARLGDTQTPQGVFCLCEMLDNLPELATICGGKYLLLASLQDPGNLGSIIRTAEALGLDELHLTADCPDLYSPKVLRATMGGVLRLPVRVVQDMPAHIALLRSRGVRVLAAALTPQAQPLAPQLLRGSVAVAIGNEGNGLPPEVITACDHSVILPMAREGQSLNAAIAAGIFMWELSKANKE